MPTSTWLRECLDELEWYKRETVLRRREMLERNILTAVEDHYLKVRWNSILKVKEYLTFELWILEEALSHRYPHDRIPDLVFWLTKAAPRGLGISSKESFMNLEPCELPLRWHEEWSAHAMIFARELQLRCLRSLIAQYNRQRSSLAATLLPPQILMQEETVGTEQEYEAELHRQLCAAKVELRLAKEAQACNQQQEVEINSSLGQPAVELVEMMDLQSVVTVQRKQIKDLECAIRQKELQITMLRG